MIVKELAETLAIGPFYYYTVRLTDNNLLSGSDTMLSIHGLEALPNDLQGITELIHPGDLDFVAAAEEAIVDAVNRVGHERQLHFKASYCFRMRVADGSYHVFHHQIVYLTSDESGALTTALCTHTDMEHIVNKNNRIVLINFIGKCKECYQIDLSERNLDRPKPLLSRREHEVLMLLAQGLSSEEIGEKLFISKLTVRVHRRHLLRKTATTNSSNLIRKCVEMSLL